MEFPKRNNSFRQKKMKNIREEELQSDANNLASLEEKENEKLSL